MSRPPQRLTLIAVLLAGAGAEPLAGQSSPGRAAPAVMVSAPAPRLIARLDVPLHPRVAASPDGRFFAALQTRPDPVLWVIPADGGEPFAFRRSWAAYRPRWSPSGDRIGFIAAIGPPRIWTVEVDPATGRPIDPPRLLHRTGANAFAFSPDGERIAMVETRSTAAGASEIRIIEWAARSVRTLLREDGMIYRLDWSPDGRFIYYGLAPETPTPDPTHQVRRVAVRGGAPETVRRSGEFLGLSPDGAYLLYRPRSDGPLDRNLVEVVRVEGGPVARIELDAAVKSVRWAASSRALVQVGAAENGDAVWEVPLCPVCQFLVW